MEIEKIEIGRITYWWIEIEIKNYLLVDRNRNKGLLTGG